ncbi:hypothetical protein TSAR_003732, partial [Trichomalopsis sarcophagae]
EEPWLWVCFDTEDIKCIQFGCIFYNECALSECSGCSKSKDYLDMVVCNICSPPGPVGVSGERGGVARPENIVENQGSKAGVGSSQPFPVPQDMVSLQENLAAIIKSATDDFRTSIISLNNKIGAFNVQLTKHNLDIRALKDSVNSIDRRLKSVERGATPGSFTSTTLRGSAQLADNLVDEITSDILLSMV